MSTELPDKEQQTIPQEVMQVTEEPNSSAATAVVDAADTEHRTIPPPSPTATDTVLAPGSKTPPIPDTAGQTEAMPTITTAQDEMQIESTPNDPPPAPSPPANRAPSDPGDADPAGTDPNPNEPALDINHALQYLDSVKAQFEDRPSTYSRFLDIMKEFKSQIIDTPVVIARVSELFHGHPQLIEGFNTFLPAGYKIECSREAGQQDMITVTTPNGQILQGTSGSSLETTVNGFRETSSVVLLPPPPLKGHAATADPTSPVPVNLPVETAAAHAPHQPPINHAIDFVNRIKTRYADEPDVYRKFLDVLQGYQKTGTGLEAVHREVTALFQHRAPDLLEEFRVFLPNQGEGGLMGLAAAGEGGRTGERDRRRRTVASDTPKRKRKAPEKDTRERELAPKASSSTSRTKKSKQHHAGNNLSPVLPPRTYVQSDEHIFFDRVRRYLETRETYDEFLKLLNFFTQGLIDGRTLLESAMSFLGESELMIKFREIVGLDGKDPLPDPIISNARVGWDRNMKALMHMGYKTAYKKLSPTADLPTCSGRDALCKSVLNDVYVLAPEINVDDGGVVAHKKNVYEEALHRTEEERHEYDFYLEAIFRTITMLEPINNKIAQQSQSDRDAFKLKPNLGGVLKSIHQRVFKKIYGREAGMEVITAMQEIPSTAIPVVLQRLRQKEEEWKRSQREWNKIWREVDKRNYYKSLDHQGITFKNNDKKMISGKFFISQIEAARDEEMFKRASLVDSSFARCRPKHQLEFVISNIPVLHDVIKLCLSYLDRVQGNYHSHERRSMEKFLRTFPATLLGLDPAEFDAALASVAEGEDVEMNDDAGSSMDEDGGSGSRPSRNRRAPNGVGSAEKDLRKKLLKSEQAKSTRNRPDGTASPRNSRHSSPARADAMQVDNPSPYGTRLSNGRSPKARAVWNPVLFCNSAVYVLYRQLLLLYSRLNKCKELADAAAGQQSSGGGHELRFGESVPAGLADNPNPAAHFYDHLLHTFEQLFDNEIEQSTFEDVLRYMFGIKAYPLFTADKLIAGIIKQVLSIITDHKSNEVCQLLARERENPQAGSLEATSAYRRSVEKMLDVDENVYRVFYYTDDSRVTFSLLGKDDAEFDDTEYLNELWRAYLDSYTTNERTDGIPLNLIRRPFLRRSLPANVPAKPPPTFSGSSALEIRVCTRTFRLFYVPGTSESLRNSYTKSALEEAIERWRQRREAGKEWLAASEKGDGKLLVGQAKEAETSKASAAADAA